MANCYIAFMSYYQCYPSGLLNVYNGGDSMRGEDILFIVHATLSPLTHILFSCSRCFQAMSFLLTFTRSIVLHYFIYLLCRYD